MKTITQLFIFCLLVLQANAQQSILDIVNQTSNQNVRKLVRDLSGEQSTTVGGSTVTITSRSNTNNTLAQQYIKEQLDATGLTVVEDNFASGGVNIYATQTGVVNPDEIYVIGAHYDSVTTYCADDNASGTAAVIELARMLSPLCLNRTLVYALWDQEEIGLRGSAAHALALQNAGANVVGVFNIDMMAYDGDDDNDFDIDVRNIANSVAMKDQIVSVLNDSSYGFTLNVNVVNPGTTASDHASFWNRGYSALLFGESWANNDQTTGYHSSSDRVSLFNYPYYFEMFRLVVASMATMVEPIFIDKTVAQNASTLTSNETGATSYQWVDCDNGNSPITNETNQTFNPTATGNYAVQITKNGCTELSECRSFTVLSTEDEELKEISIFPNPVEDKIIFEGLNVLQSENVRVTITSISGKKVFDKMVNKTQETLSVKDIASGAYILQVKTNDGKEKVIKFLKK